MMAIIEWARATEREDQLGQARRRYADVQDRIRRNLVAPLLFAVVLGL